jgi:hypothetical protein
MRISEITLVGDEPTHSVRIIVKSARSLLTIHFNEFGAMAHRLPADMKPGQDLRPVAETIQEWCDGYVGKQGEVAPYLSHLQQMASENATPRKDIVCCRCHKPHKDSGPICEECKR